MMNHTTVATNDTLTRDLTVDPIRVYTDAVSIIARQLRAESFGALTQREALTIAKRLVKEGGR